MDNFDKEYRIHETVFASSNTVIQRATKVTDGSSVVVKKPAQSFPDANLTESFKKDYQFTKMLHSSYPKYFINMVELVEQKNGSVFLVEEEGSEVKTFSTQNENFQLTAFLKVALDMATSVSCAHSKHVLHRDIKLRNFVIGQDQTTKLIDFGLAVVVSRKSPSVPCNSPIGTYSYMSPEQTGRISKNVDFRSDIYSLGITFYEILTGKVPFDGDKMSVVHAHITKKLPNIQNVPKAVNEVIQKMCSKSPSDRYNSASGVVKDLEFILKNVENVPESFVVGQNDVKEFQIPNKIYGREKQVEFLKTAITSKSDTNMCLVSGYSGMGKSALIDELAKDKNLNFIFGYGKFDQFNRATPYSAFITIVKSLISKVSSGSSEDKKKICQLLNFELKDVGSVLIDVVPEIEILIGKQNPAVELSNSEEIQKRFFNTLISFFNCFTSDGTLILVIDDLQWSDSASFSLLEHLLTLKDGKIFVIGAYRDNEVDENHPLMVITSQFQSIKTINLQPLTLEDLNEMISETLEIERETTLELSRLIHKKTGGNPFFAREFINTLYQEELITLKNGKWNWSISEVEKMNFSSNVIDFMIGNLKKFPESTQKILNRAACFGNVFEVEELLWIWDESSDIHTELIEPVKGGWLLQLNSNQYKFFHDRLQQSAYEILEESQREKIHSIIGSTLLKKYKEQKAVEKEIFEIVNHLNIAKSQSEDKIALLELNLMAARKSLDNSAFASALKFAKIAIELLPDDSWSKNHSVARETHSVYASTCYANSLLEEAEKEYLLLLEHVTDKVEKLRVNWHYIKMCSLTFQFDKAYNLLLDSLKLFELTKDIPTNDEEAFSKWNIHLKSNVDAEVKVLGGWKQIHKLKKCDREDIDLLLAILAESIGAVFLSALSTPLMILATSIISLHYFLNYGLNDTAPVGLGMAGWNYSFFYKDPNGYQITQAAEKLVQENKNPKFNFAAVEFLLGMGIVFGGSLKQSLFHFDIGSKYAMSHGEYVFGAYNLNNYGMIASVNGYNIPQTLPKMKKYQSWVQSIKNFFISDLVEAQINFMRDLAGVAKWDPQFLIPVIREAKCSGACILSFQGMLQFHNYDYENALVSFEALDPKADEVIGFSSYYDGKLFHALTLIHFYKSTKDEKQMKRIQEYIEEFEVFALIGPEYLAPRCQLLKACFQTIQSTNVMKTLGLFEEVLVSSTKFGLPIIAAVTNESMLEFCEENDFLFGICNMYFHNAMKAWSALGAKSKCEKMKMKFPKYIQTGLSRASGDASTMTSISSTSSLQSTSVSVSSFGGDSLDMMSIIKASQALSVEVSTSSLIVKVMNVIIENTGAENGLLILNDQGVDYITASLENGKFLNLHKNAKESEDMFCLFLYEMSKAVRKTIIINDVKKSEYSDNKYLQSNNVKSLCIHPIFKGNNFIGGIYLENKTLEGIFDENRKQILEHISSQLAISYENAKLYDDMNSLNASYERFLPKEFLKQLGKGDVRNIKKGDASTKKICVLFSDIRSFTDITEKMDAEQSFSFVNEIFSYLAPIISKHNGFIDKFFGDCIMALFPYEVDDSIKCGFEMLSALETYNKDLRSNMQPVEIGIGIHYGDVMLGTIGAEERIDATVISDTVNTASRVESLTKSLGATFIITEDLLKNSTTNYQHRYIGKYLLKGKQNPMALFQMIPEKSSIDIEKFTKGIQLFESRKFEESHEIFKGIEDKTSNYLENVANVYASYNFPDSWTGEIKIDKDGNLVQVDFANLKSEQSMKNMSKEDQKKFMEKLIESGKLQEFISTMFNYSGEEMKKFI